MEGITSRFFFLFLLIFSASSAHGFTGAPPITKPVEWGDVESLREIGNHWVLGVGKNQGTSNAPLAIYDLSYRGLESGQSIQLGCLDWNCSDYSKVVQLIFEGAEKGGVRENSPEQVRALSQAVDALRDLEAKSAGSSNPLPAQWWKSIAWKQRSLALMEDAPEHFSLDDIHYESWIKDFAKISKDLEKWGGSGFLKGFEFIRRSTGGYDLVWRSYSVSPNWVGVAPFKVADLSCTQCIMAGMLTEQAIAQILYLLIGQIPVPVVGGLLNTAIGQWLHLHSEMIRFHHEGLLEVIQSAEEKGAPPTGPFANVDEKVRSSAVASVYYARSSLLDFWQWISKTPFQTWELDKTTSTTQAEDSARYLAQNGYQLTTLNPRFALAKDSRNRSWIYLLAAPRFWNILPPFKAIDYQEPYSILAQRLTVEGAYILINFATSLIPVPVVGTIVSQIFEQGVHVQMHVVQHWEARLNTHLQLRQLSGENWSFEMESLRRQAVNPLLLNWDEILKTIQLRRKGLGLGT